VPAAGDKLAAGLDSREGPNLSQVGQRYQPSWLYHWLKNPQAVSPAAVMPCVFSDDDQGRTELYAVTRYLESLGGPSQEMKPSKQLPESIKRGRQLFSTTGCVVCHPHAKEQAVAPEAPLLYHLASATGPSRTYPLPDQSAKTTPAHLAAYLLNPHKTDPSGRMPQVVTDAKDAQDLANFLCLRKEAAKALVLPAAPEADKLRQVFFQVEQDAGARATFAKLNESGQWMHLGQRLLAERNCLACHSMQAGKAPAPPKVAQANFDAVKIPASHKRGCLADNAK
jgi:cytochrome c2